MQGLWAAGFLPRLLWDVHVNRKTGALRLRRGDERHGFHFHSGRIVDGETSLEEQSLTGFLERENRITPSDLRKAAETARSNGRGLPLVLIEQGVADVQQVGRALTEAVRAAFRRVMQWNDGLYAFDAQAATEHGGDSTIDVPTAEIILDIVRDLPGEETLRSIVEDLDVVLIPSTDPLLRFQPLQLNPAEGYALSRVDGTTSAREILQIIPNDAAEAARTLAALVCLGFVECLSGVRRNAKTAATARPHGRPNASPAHTNSSSAARSASPPLKHKVNIRNEISSLFKALDDKNHFELLDLSHNATEPQIKDAYFRLAKKYHPDTHSDPEFAELRDMIEAIFMRLGVAYETLRDPNKRAAYETKIGVQKKTPVAVVAPPPPPDPAQLLKTARKHFDKEKYWDAIQALESLIPLAAGETKVEGLLLLGKAYLKNPHWLKQAEAQLLLAVEADPRHAEAHFLLGTIYHDKGLRARASGRFKRVLEINPQHEEAAARLIALEPETPESQASEGGLLRKILKKE